MRGKVFLEKKKEEMKDVVVQAYPVSSKTLTIIEYLKGKEKERKSKRKRKIQEKNVHIMVVLREKSLKIF